MKHLAPNLGMGFAPGKQEPVSHGRTPPPHTGCAAIGMHIPAERHRKPLRELPWMLKRGRQKSPLLPHTDDVPVRRCCRTHTPGNATIIPYAAHRLLSRADRAMRRALRSRFPARPAYNGRDLSNSGHLNAAPERLPYVTLAWEM